MAGAAVAEGSETAVAAAAAAVVGGGRCWR